MITTPRSPHEHRRREPIHALPLHRREKLEAAVHHALNVANARIRNTDPKYSEQLQKVEKEAWYELAQLCEEYGVSMGPFYLQRRYSERLWKALEHSVKKNRPRQRGTRIPHADVD